jgi:putative ABC transport system ATP-binding protein
LLADEPTGNLDQETGDRLHGLLRRLNHEKGITVIVVTHNERLAAACDRTLRLEGGRLHAPRG